jgi:hypothetical protein
LTIITISKISPVTQNPIALIEVASFCAGVRHKRYSGEQESAPENFSDKWLSDWILNLKHHFLAG